MSETNLRYQQAMDRLEQILAHIDDSAVGIDELAGQVQEATALLKSCRQMLVQTEAGVQEALRSLDAEFNPSSTPDRDL